MEPRLFVIAIAAFACEWVDSTLGMGYGTSLTPILLLLGYEPMQFVPCVLLSEFATGTAAAIFHHRARNADFRRGSIDRKVAAVLAFCSVLGVVGAVFVAANVPRKVLT